MQAAELRALLRKEFSKGKAVPLVVTGYSMRPMLRHGKDRVVLVAPETRPPARGEIVLFFRDDGSCVLHRVIGERGGALVVNGDAQTWTETVRRDQVAAVVCGVVRRGRYLACDAASYRLRAGLWERLRPARGAFIALDTALYRAAIKMGLRKRDDD